MWAFLIEFGAWVVGSGAWGGWRQLGRIDAVALDEVVCAWIRACLTRVNAAVRARSPDRRPVRRVLAVDGEAMRATLRWPGPMHLRCALDHARGVVVAQVSVDVKTNEIPLFATLAFGLASILPARTTSSQMQESTEPGADPIVITA